MASAASSSQPPASSHTSNAQSGPSTQPAENRLEDNTTTSGTQTKFAMGFVIPAAILSVPLIAIAIAALAVSWDAKLRRKKERKTRIEKEAPWHVDVESDMQAYLQSKGELATTDQTRYQLHADQMERELQGDPARCELCGEENQIEVSATKDRRRMTALLGQGLAGEDQRWELESPEHR